MADESDSKPTPLRITDLPEDARPRERLKAVGAKHLTNAELLAIMLRVGNRGESALRMAERILHQINGPAGLLRTPLTELMQIKGMGLAKSAQVKAAVELGYRVARAELGTRPQITSPQEVAELLSIHMAGLEQEVVKVVMLNTRNEIISINEIYRGVVNGVSVRVGELFREAVRCNATNIIIAHNHPSGDPTPSGDDIALTRNIVEAGRLLDVNVIDHLIIGQGRWVSLKEHKRDLF